MTARTTRSPCPRCGSTEVIPIVYGYPSLEVLDASERGDVRLGG